MTMVEHEIAAPRTQVSALLLTFKEAMEFLRVSRSTMYRLMWSGQLRGHKVGSSWRFYEQDLLAAVASPSWESRATSGSPPQERANMIGDTATQDVRREDELIMVRPQDAAHITVQREGRK